MFFLLQVAGDIAKELMPEKAEKAAKVVEAGKEQSDKIIGLVDKGQILDLYEKVKGWSEVALDNMLKWQHLLPYIIVALLLLITLIWMKKRKVNKMIIWGLLAVILTPTIDAFLQKSQWIYYNVTMHDFLIFFRFAAIWWTISLMAYRLLAYSMPFNIDVELMQSKNPAIIFLISSIFVVTGALIIFFFFFVKTVEPLAT